MRAAIYVRVSTDEQAREGFSIEAQKRRLVAFSESQDWLLSEIYIDDGYSAKDLNRPEMKRLLTDLELGRFDVVLVYKLDRLTRSTSDCDYLLKTFEAHKVAFQSCTESFETRTATGRLFIRLIADIAQWERENIGERVRFGQEQKVFEGKKPGGKHPFGYDKQGTLIPEEAETLRRLRELYMKENLGFKSIAIRLNAEGRNRRGFDWRSSTAALALENPFYAGIIEFGGRMANGKYPQRKKELRVEVLRSKGSHEVMWSEDEFNEHIRLMRQRTDGGYSRKLDYWFSGLLRCGNCGQGMYGRLTTGRVKADGTRDRKPYYICGQRKENDLCNQPIFQQRHIEHLVMEHIGNLRKDEQVTTAEQKKLRSQQASVEKSIQKLQREIDNHRDRIKKWQFMFVEGLISSDDLRARLDEEHSKETDARYAIESLKGQAKESEHIQTHLFNLSDLWPHLDGMEKKEMLSTFIEEIRVYSHVVKPKGVKNKFFDAHIELKYR